MRIPSSFIKMMMLLLMVLLGGCHSGVDRHVDGKALQTALPSATPTPTRKPGSFAKDILDAALKKNSSEISKIMEGISSVDELNLVFYEVLKERITYPIDLDAQTITQQFVDHHVNINAIDPTMHGTPLVDVSSSTVGDFVIPLVLAGADVNATDANHDTPLHFMANRGNPARVQFLLDHGGRVNAKDDMGMTPLLSAMRPFGHTAFIEENVRIVKMLVQAGANVNDKDQDGNAPLIFAARYNQKELVQYLIDHGADVNAKNKDGSTPLIEAVIADEGYESEQSVLEVVDILLQSGADPTTIVHQGGNAAPSTALSISMEKNMPKVSDRIRNQFNTK